MSVASCSSASSSKMRNCARKRSASHDRETKKRRKRNDGNLASEFKSVADCMSVGKNGYTCQMSDKATLAALLVEQNYVKLQSLKNLAFVPDVTAISEEIWEHYRLNVQDPSTFERKLSLRQSLINTLRKAFGVNSIDLYAVGSTVNGTGSYNSDMDLCLTIPDPSVGYDTQRGFSLDNLRFIRKALRQCTSVGHVVLIPARVPILRMTCLPFNIEVDLNINNVVGIYNSHLLHYYAKADTRLPALALAIKHWAIRKNICDAKNGTLNSYSLILLIIHYLQCGVDPPVLPNLQKVFPELFSLSRPLKDLRLFLDLPAFPGKGLNTMTVGELMRGFFKYYTEDFNFEHYAISICGACTFNRDRLPNDDDRFFIYIAEPYDEQNTARSLYDKEKFDTVFAAFQEACYELCASKRPRLQSIGVSLT